MSRAPGKYVFRVAKPLDRSSPEYWSARARASRQLFPSDVLVLHRDGNELEKQG